MARVENFVNVYECMCDAHNYIYIIYIYMYTHIIFATVAYLIEH